MDDADRHRAIAEIIRRGSVEAATWGAEPEEGWIKNRAQYYYHWALAGDYTAERIGRDWPRHPEIFGMAPEEFTALRLLIYT